MFIDMPKLSSVDPANIIRASLNDPPLYLAIVAVTADIHCDYNSVVSKHGTDDYVANPIPTVEQNDLIDQYCRAP